MTRHLFFYESQTGGATVLKPRKQNFEKCECFRVAQKSHYSVLCFYSDLGKESSNRSFSLFFRVLLVCMPCMGCVLWTSCQRVEFYCKAVRGTRAGTSLGRVFATCPPFLLKKSGGGGGYTPVCPFFFLRTCSLQPSTLGNWAGRRTHGKEDEELPSVLYWSLVCRVLWASATPGDLCQRV